MPSRDEITYFGAGPALLPTDVLERAAAALVNYRDTGLGLAEHSHRSELASAIVRDARADLAAFLDVPTADYEVVLMQAGGTGEFAAVVYNLVGAWVLRQRAALVAEGVYTTGGGPSAADEDPRLLTALRTRVDRDLRVDYVVTGSWSLKAYQEAQRLLGPEHVHLVADGRRPAGAGAGADAGAGAAAPVAFGAIPDEAAWSLSPDAAYVYYCDNETVDGVEFPAFPAILAASTRAGVPVVADMSSNILSRPVPVDRYGLFFFGAQKNLGCTGITVTVVRKDLLPQPSPALLRALGLPIGPIVLSYETMAKNESLYNTLSIFDVYIAGQVLKNLLATYPDKAAGQEKVSNHKARLLYAALDAHPAVYHVCPATAARSRMNIVFRVAAGGGAAGGDRRDAAEKAFLKEAAALGLTGLKGHRSVGGIRASNYNSIPVAGAEKLAAFLHAFAKKAEAEAA